eukprot:scaffold8774_cov19-Tisochrysis_lutea.AAC.2
MSSFFASTSPTPPSSLTTSMAWMCGTGCIDEFTDPICQCENTMKGTQPSDLLITGIGHQKFIKLERFTAEKLLT